jgi:hypothetical protein
VSDDVKMIGHDDEAAREPAVTLWAVEEEGNQPLKRGFVVENATATIHARCQEVGNVAVGVGPDAVQAAQAAWRWVVGAAVWGHTAYRARVVVGRVPRRGVRRIYQVIAAWEHAAYRVSALLLIAHAARAVFSSFSRAGDCSPNN